MEKIRVAIICQFSTQEIREHIKLGNRRFYGVGRRLLGLPYKSSKYSDYALWDANLIEQLEKREDVELHVILAHEGMKKLKEEFRLRNTNYTLIKCDYTTLLRYLVPWVGLWKKLNIIKYIVHKKINEIKPDVVMLIGAEVSHISSTVLGLERKYPTCVLTQTIYNNPDRGKYGHVDKKNAAIEIEIFKRLKHIGVYSNMHENLLRKIAPADIDVFRFNFPVSKMPEVTYVGEKKYDFVNFALSMSLQKGFNDSIEALAIVKKKYPKVHLNLVGNAVGERKQEFQELIARLGLTDNVSITPSFDKQEDVFRHIQQSRFAVLPCKLDNISGTMLQSLNYGLPLIVYSTPGTIQLNKNERSALIANHCDIHDLAEKMLHLMDNSVLAEGMKKNAKKYIERYYKESEGNVSTLVGNLKRIAKQAKTL